MQSKEEIQDYLQKHAIIQEASGHNEAYDRIASQYKNLSEANKSIALQLTNYSATLNEIEDQNERSRQRLANLKAWLPIQNTFSGDRFEILEALFGKENAQYISDAWESLDKLMYQTGYSRRSFRAPNKPELYMERKISWLENLWRAWKYDFSLAEYATYANHIASYYKDPFAHVFAAALRDVESEVFTVIKQIIFDEDSNGTVSRSIIKALLLSDEEKHWEVVKKLLLAAQRQEGLRQTILESLDETSIGAMKYMMQLIVDEDLLRFSSVVRSLDVWAGLGWKAESKKTVQTFIELGLRFLNQPQAIAQAVKSKNNAEVYMALWAKAVYNVYDVYPLLEQLLATGNEQKRIVAFYFASQTDLPDANNDLVTPFINSESMVDLYWLTRLLPSKELAGKFTDFQELHQYIQQWYGKLPDDKKPFTFQNKAFRWLQFSISKSTLEKCWIEACGENSNYLAQLQDLVPDFALDNRKRYTRKALSDFAPGYYYQQQEEKQPEKEPTEFQRDYALICVSDRAEYIRNAGLHTLKQVRPEPGEVEEFEDLLRRKSGSLREGIISILLKLNDEEALQSAERLIGASRKQQRLAGLDLIKQLIEDNRAEKQSRALIKAYKEEKEPTPDELLILDAIFGGVNDQYNRENGWGLFNKEQVTPAVLPGQNKKHFFYKRFRSGFFTKEKVGYSKPVEKVKKQLQKLDALLNEHATYEYETETYSGRQKTVLLGNELVFKKYKTRHLSAEERFQLLPLHKVWNNWYTQSGLDAIDLRLLSSTHHSPGYNNQKTNWFRSIVEQWHHSFILYTYHSDNRGDFKNGKQMQTILQALSQLHRSKQESSYYLENAINFIHQIPADKRHEPVEGEGYYSPENFTKSSYFSGLLNNIRFADLSKKEKNRYCQTIHWLVINFSNFREKLSAAQFINLFTHGFLNENDVYFYLFNEHLLREFTRKINYRREADDKSYKLVRESKELKQVIDRVLEIEFGRGETDTDVSHFAKAIERIEGMEYYVKCLQSLGKENLVSRYYYRGKPSKREMMSNLLGYSHPKETETQEDFNRLVEKSKLSDKRLIESALFAPQWRFFVQNYLQMDGLDSAIWWLYAHSTDYLNKEKESEIAKFSAISLQDFKDGAVDIDWFHDVYNRLGKKNWEVIYNAAKYLSHGNGHTLAKLYADVILRNVKIREVTKRVKEKRNKNYLRVYGVVPLSKTVPEKDLLKRYNYLQQFLKESKQFGSQRQASEATAVRVAMDNLARTAGYADPIRLQWAMEGEYVKNILGNAKQLVFDDLSIQLQITEMGKPKLMIHRGDRQLKNVPAKLRKKKEVKQLKAYKKELKQQYSRTRHSLEQAMVVQDDFTKKEVENLFQHPVVKPMVSKLLFSCNNHIGFWDHGHLKAVDGSTYEVSDEDKLVLTHCTALHASKQWSQWQQHCFNEKLKQPFKQIFRELYLPTPDELKDGVYSHRYEGHQVQPKKTVALLKSRGWKVDYDSGLQKVYHKFGIRAELYAMADWFSPADVESPTFETVSFYNTGDYKHTKLEEVPPFIFSEIMRDVDLVVSVAHVGGVDPEASLSTIEMRKVLAEETARLFQLQNVEFAKNHILIEGSHANYSLHLGSGVVHIRPGGYVSILPVHSQHRGRIFLPFVDSDPKTAEILSKLLLLANDQEIKDPTILGQMLGS